MHKISEMKPSEGELEILQILWKMKSATVRDVYQEICLTKECGYTTTLKIMQIMYEKELVTRDNSQKTHIYFPNISREKTQKQLVGKMIHSLFSGSTSELILQALGNDKPTENELDEIQAMINKLKNAE